jgi:hypothetical protein
MSKLRRSVAARALPWVVIGACICPFSNGQGQESKGSEEILTNDKIVTLVKGGFPSSIIVKKIQASKTDFKLDTGELVRLKQNRVPDEVINAMLEASSSSRASPSPKLSETSTALAVPSPTNDQKAGGLLRKESRVEGPEAFLLDRETRFQLEPVFPAIVQTKAKGDNLATAIGDAELSKLESDVVSRGASAALAAVPGGSIPITMASGDLMRRLPKFMHDPIFTFIYALAHGRSTSIIASTTPKFEVRFPDVTGADPDDFQAEILKLVSTKNNWRLLGLRRSKQSAFESSERTEWNFKEGPIPARIRKIARGVFEIEPVEPLAPGEYGLVIRPVSPTYKFSPKESVMKAGEGVLLLPIWDFSIEARSIKPQEE